MSRPGILLPRLMFVSGLVTAIGCFVGSTVIHANSWFSVIFDNPPTTVFVAKVFGHGALVGVLIAAIGFVGWMAAARRVQ